MFIASVCICYLGSCADVNAVQRDWYYFMWQLKTGLVYRQNQYYTKPKSIVWSCRKTVHLNYAFNYVESSLFIFAHLAEVSEIQ